MPTATRTATQSQSTNPSSEEALIRRILYSSLPRNAAIPILLPLDESKESNRRINHSFSLLLSLLLREAILSWYAKLTPNRDLLEIITEILAQIIQESSFKLNNDDGKERIGNLVRNEIPNILLDHFREVSQTARLVHSGYARAAWDTIKDKPSMQDDNGRKSSVDKSVSNSVQTSESGSYESRTIGLLYSISHPHPALSPTSTWSGQISVDYLASLLYEVLLNTLPEEDSKPDTEILIVRDVLTGVLRGTLSKCSRPWFITQSLNRILDILKVDRDYVVGDDRTAERRKLEEAKRKEASQEKPTSTILTTIFVTLERLISIIQILYLLLMPHVVRGYLQVFSTSNKSLSNSTENSGTQREGFNFNLDEEESSNSNKSRRAQQSSDSDSSKAPGGRRWSIWNGGSSRTDPNNFPASLKRRRGLSRHGIVAASEDESSFKWEDGALPEERSTLSTLKLMDSDMKDSSIDEFEEPLESRESKVAPQFLPQIVELLKEILTLRDRSLGNQLANFLDLGVVLFGKKAEDLIISQASPHITPDLFVNLIDTTRESLLPGGHFGVAPPDPSPKQQVLEFERLKRRVWGFTPSPVRILLFGFSTRKQKETLHDALSPICSPESEGPMTHLALKLMERICVLLVPELEKSD